MEPQTESTLQPAPDGGAARPIFTSAAAQFNSETVNIHDKNVTEIRA
jgi:hypothetical protein